MIPFTFNSYSWSLGSTKPQTLTNESKAIASRGNIGLDS